jgi:aminoglycoside phosphotransferase (APT) family kinase protein
VSTEDKINEAVRPTPTMDNPESIRLALQDWMSTKLATEVVIAELNVPEGTGMSNVTLLFDAAAHGQSDSYVARIQPQGEGLAFPSYDLKMQCVMMQAVADSCTAPMPTIIGEESDARVLGMPFYIMTKTDGLIPPDLPPYHMDGWLKETTAQNRHRVWMAGIDEMAKVNIIDIEQPVMAAAIASESFPKSLTEQLQYWQDYYAWGYGDHVNASCEQALIWLKANQPKEQVTALCWGDSRMANIIVKEDMRGIAALIDWEMLALGDPLQDIAWWIYMDELMSTGIGVERLEGIPDRLVSAQHWAEKTGLSIDNLHYYLIFAAMRFALILGRMSIAGGNAENTGGGFEAVYLQGLLDQL